MQKEGSGAVSSGSMCVRKRIFKKEGGKRYAAMRQGREVGGGAVIVGGPESGYVPERKPFPV